MPLERVLQEPGGVAEGKTLLRLRDRQRGNVTAPVAQSTRTAQVEAAAEGLAGKSRRERNQAPR